MRALIIAVMMLAGLAAAGAAQHVPAGEAAPVAALEPIKLELDRIAAAVEPASASQDALADLRRRLVAIRDDLRERIAALERRLAETDSRLKALGSPPAAGAPPEDPALAAEREQMSRRRAEIDAALRQARLFAARAGELNDTVVERGRALFTGMLFQRSASVLDPYFWIEIGKAVPGEMASAEAVLQAWLSHARATGGRAGMAAAAATLAAFAAAALLLALWWRRRGLGRFPAETRFAKSVVALAFLLRIGAAAPLAVAVILLVLDAYGLITPAMFEIGAGLVVATAVASIGRGVGVALFAPDAASRRLIALDDRAARGLNARLTWGARLTGAAVLLNIVHKALGTPVSLTVATSAALALAVALLLLWPLALRLPERAAGAVDPRIQWLRAAAWLAGATILVCLAIGYVGLAAFLAGRALTVVIVLGALYIGLVFVDTLFTEVVTGDSARGRAIGGALGLKARGVELLGTLISALLRVLLVLLALLPILGPSGLFAADFFAGLRDSVFAFRIGEVTVSIPAILTACALLLVVVVLTRTVQRWLQTRFLPRTGIEPGLQHSVSTIVGYVGFIAALALALDAVGIDLQKIALIAGALSIGIGFGLQSVVSNFVSGLILLAERPIRVGDWIVVKGEEGHVRRISVRATEIETFERASVIIPNSEFITGVVKNWTHANTTGRIAIKVGVAYDSDPEAVRAILLACAADHPNVLKTPPPSALLLNFGDSALEFELRCFLANVFNGITVKSDLHFAILRRLREAKIQIPFPQREVRLLGDARLGAA